MPDDEVDSEPSTPERGEADETEHRFLAHLPALTVACGRGGILKLSSGRQTQPRVSRAAMAVSFA